MVKKKNCIHIKKDYIPKYHKKLNYLKKITENYSVVVVNFRKKFKISLNIVMEY